MVGASGAKLECHQGHMNRKNNLVALGRQEHVAWGVSALAGGAGAHRGPAENITPSPAPKAYSCSRYWLMP